MPKQMIWNWRETRIIKIFLICVFLFATCYMTLGFLSSAGTIKVDFPNYYPLSSPMQMDGKLCSIQLSKDLNTTNVFISIMTFIEYVLLCIALKSQWQIDKEFNLFIELLLITFVWGGCNTIINYVWIMD
jgi:hypothetical protein